MREKIKDDDFSKTIKDGVKDACNRYIECRENDPESPFLFDFLEHFVEKEKSKGE